MISIFWLRATQVISTSVLPSLRSISLLAIFNIFSTFLSGGSHRTCQWQCTECVKHLLLWQTPGNLDTQIQISNYFQIISKLFSGGIIQDMPVTTHWVCQTPSALANPREFGHTLKDTEHCAEQTQDLGHPHPQSPPGQCIMTLPNPQTINSHILIQTMHCITGQPGAFYGRTACARSIPALKIPMTFWIKLIIVHG